MILGLEHLQILLHICFGDKYLFGKDWMSTIATSSLFKTTQDNSHFSPTLFYVSSLDEKDFAYSMIFYTISSV